MKYSFKKHINMWIVWYCVPVVWYGIPILLQKFGFVMRDGLVLGWLGIYEGFTFFLVAFHMFRFKSYFEAKYPTEYKKIEYRVWSMRPATMYKRSMMLESLVPSDDNLFWERKANMESSLRFFELSMLITVVAFVLYVF